MKMWLKKAGVAVGLVLAVAGFYAYLAPRPGIVSTDNAYVHGEITQISAEVPGVVTRLHVSDNQFVERGDLLAELDNRDYLARLDQANSALATAEATIANVDSRILLQQVNIEEAATGIVAARADAELQHKEWQRYSDLLAKHLIAQSEYDSQHTRMQQTRAGLQAAELRLTAARRQLDALSTERDRLTAQRDQASAAVELAKLQLEDTAIRAPVSGIIGNRSVRTGRYVQPGMPLLAIVPVDDIWVEANYKESQLTNILPGQSVDIRLDVFPDTPLTGTVISVSPATGAQFSLLPPDNATGNFVKIVQRVPVKMSIQFPTELRGRIVPGLSAEVAVDTGA